MAVWCVIGQVRVDLSEEKVRELEAKAQKEKDELQQKAKQVHTHKDTDAHTPTHTHTNTHKAQSTHASRLPPTTADPLVPSCLPLPSQDIDQLVRAQAKTVEEREALRQRLEKEAADRDSILQQKSMLQDKLKAMQEKLIQVRGLKS